jgi:hypothetical protein
MSRLCYWQGRRQENILDGGSSGVEKIEKRALVFEMICKI